MGAEGHAYRQLTRARRDAKFKKISGAIMELRYSPTLREVCESVDAHPGENPELDKAALEILNVSKRLNLDVQATNRAYQKQRARFRVVI
jgi:hypothetical protein